VEYGWADGESLALVEDGLRVDEYFSVDVRMRDSGAKS
jgi:hypothetical protein